MLLPLRKEKDAEKNIYYNYTRLCDFSKDIDIRLHHLEHT